MENNHKRGQGPSWTVVSIEKGKTQKNFLTDSIVSQISYITSDFMG
jgi:hypothetical protein